MKKITLNILLIGISSFLYAQFPPAAGQPGSTAIHKDSAVFTGWATSCAVVRGLQDLSNKSLIYASVGDSSMALDIAGSNGVVSLGDGGYAIVKFANPIRNGEGWDFAVFENSFSDTYLELAFVEVSSDGSNYFRFPSTSNTDTTIQVDGFGDINPTKIDNLAGKYRALYGTPFDLKQLASQPNLNINAVTHVKIIDVAGSIMNPYARRDQYGHKINDPWPTPFPSSGFDLDAVGVIHTSNVNIAENFIQQINFNVYPNPIKGVAVAQFKLDKQAKVALTLTGVMGNKVLLHEQLCGKGIQQIHLNTSTVASGIYLLSAITEQGIATQKIIINNE